MPEELEQLDATQGGGETSGEVSTQDAARKMASIIAKGVTGEQQIAETAAAAGTGTAEGGAAAGADATQAVVDEALEQDAVEERPISEIEETLQAAGIDLGLTAADIPDELRPAYERLVQSAVNRAQDVLDREVEASQALRQVEEFSRRLEEAPDKLLLTIAVSRPDIFKKVAEMVTEMESNPNAKDIVIRELQSEARLREAERREGALNERELRAKAQIVIAATKRAAAQHGVPFELAEEMVALKVKASDGKLDVSEVDTIVSKLRAATRKPAKPRVASPQKVQATKGAPQGEVAGGSTATKLQPATERTGGGGIFARLVKDAAAKLRGSQQ